ncbi:sulfite exporter TauE/SafE family protein [Halalkalibacter oceani]|uniref:sulfite exporter TauE/SafE family protein n=1 Tax=Halalkalibacter oceani TaxID=1653776 RepID=UPI003394B2A7
MLELSWFQIVLVGICAIFIGIAKTGLPALTILVVATMASIFPARDSIGISLPMLITADLIAVAYYRHTVHWKTLLRMLPWVLGGLAAGYVLLFFVTVSRPIEIILGLIIISMVSLQIYRAKAGAKWLTNIPQSKLFIGVMGTLAGFTTMIGNAAGPVMAIFLLALALPKNVFIGTGAWFFLAVNLIKVPLYVNLDLITGETFLFYLWFIPIILLGSLIGIKALPYIPQKNFNLIIMVLAGIGGIRLLLPW